MNTTKKKGLVSRFNWMGSKVLLLFLLGHFLHHLCTAVHVPLLPFIRDDFGLDYFKAGLLVSAFSFSYGLSQLPMGWLADRFGRRTLLTVGFIGVALSAIGIGFSRNFSHIIIGLITMGLFGGTYHPSAPPLISQSVPLDKRGQSLGIHLIGGSASYFLAPLFAGLIVSALIWKSVFIIMAVPTLLAAILFWKAVKEKPQSATATIIEDKNEKKGSMMLLIILLAVTVVGQSATSGSAAFIPMYLVDKHGVAKETAAMLLSLVYVAGIVAAPLGGYLSDRIGRKPVIFISAFATGIVIYIITIAPLGFFLWLLFILLGAAMYSRMAVIESFIVDVTNAKRRSSVLGIYYLLTLEASTIITPAIGFLIDRFGQDKTLTILSIWVLMITFVALIVLQILKPALQPRRGN